MTKKKKPKRTAKPRRGHRRGRVSGTAGFRVLHLPEPALTFAYEQALEDPRDGLTLFGPLDAGRPYGIRVGVIGTSIGIALYRAWVARIQGRLTDTASQVAKPPFPGFESVFRVPWGLEPALALTVPEAELERAADREYSQSHTYVSSRGQFGGEHRAGPVVIR